MIIQNPCHINKELDRIRISEIVLPQKKRKITKIYPKEIKSLFLFKHSSISVDVLPLLKDKEIYILNGNKVDYFFMPSEYLPKRYYYDSLLSKMKEKEKRKVALIFCKGVCFGRIKTLIRLNEARKNYKIKKIIKNMQELNRKLPKQWTIEKMKAIEGNIANYFYKAISETNNDFKKRDRNSKDLMNVLINYTHSILRTRVYRSLLLNNFNPYYGFLHFQKDVNKPFLSWDFSEFWIPYCDKLCLYIIERGIVDKSDIKDGKLSKKARINVIKLIEKRIKVKEINNKIEEFKGFLENRKKFGWIIS